MLLRLVSLTRGYSGVRPVVVETLTACLNEGIQRVRPFPEQAAIARDIRRYLAGSHLVREPGRDKVQDAYALRCIPQVHGASLHALRHVQETLEIEMNAVTDNPLLFPEENAVYSGGNFHGQPIALAMDYLKIAIAELANIAERRTERLARV
ncbi:hypothetical protein AAC03nite_23720 [Alicyclobacillus acidoterrestris]|nr:hypothetical protein AAC03nite_23720 [Alicyclobacillus acidoterrestris]